MNITITNSKSIGFKNIQAITDFGGGIVETANGINAFEVKPENFNPLITSISPAQGFPDEDLAVVITGINTNFSDLSSPNIGSGITINNVNAVSSTLIEASISISESAFIGFRDVTVVTGYEYAYEEILGPFLVSYPPAIIPELMSITPNTGNIGQTLFVEIIGMNTNFEQGMTTLSFSGGEVVVNNLKYL